MAVNFAVGTITAPNAPGTLNVAVGFQAKAVLLQGCLVLGYDSFVSDGIYLDWGWALQGSSSIPQDNFFFGSVWSGLFNGQVSAGYNRVGEAEFFGSGTNFSSTVNQKILLTSIDATSFTLTWNYVNDAGNAFKYDYIAIGGDISVNAGNVSVPTSTGAQTIAHGLTGTPAFAMFGTALQNTVQNSTSTNAGGFSMRGWTDGTNQGVTSYMDGGNVIAVNGHPSYNRSYQRTNKCLAILSTADGSVLSEAGITSLDATNITLNWTTAGSFSVGYYWFAISGLYAQAGSFAQTTTATTQAVSTTTVKPTVLLVQSFGAVATTTSTTSIAVSQGITDGSQQHATWGGQNNGANSYGASLPSRIHIDTSTIYSASNATERAKGTIAFGTNGFTNTYTVVDTTQRQWVFLALGSTTGGGGGTTTPTTLSAIYKLDASLRVERLITNTSTQQDYMIPNPFIETGLLPEEQ